MAGRKAIEMTGRTCGRWTVLHRSSTNRYSDSASWTCRCTCGTVRDVDADRLRDGTSKSCGCLRDELSSARVSRGRLGIFKLGRPSAGWPEYAAWSAMKNRCSNSNYPFWKDYGGRGIHVCDRWLNSFEHFLADVGPRPEGKLKNGQSTYSLDRYPNGDGNYEPGNVRWATRSQQNSNKRRGIRRLLLRSTSGKFASRNSSSGNCKRVR